MGQNNEFNVTDVFLLKLKKGLPSVVISFSVVERGFHSGDVIPECSVRPQDSRLLSCCACLSTKEPKVLLPGHWAHLHTSRNIVALADQHDFCGMPRPPTFPSYGKI